MESEEKLETPALAATDFKPERTPPPGFVPMATVIVALDVVTVLPKVSWIATCTAGARGTPAVALVGWTMKASLEAVAATTLKPAEVAALKAPEVAERV